MDRRTVLMWACCLVAVAAVAGATYALWPEGESAPADEPEPPAPAEQTLDDALGYLASPAFAKQSEAEKLAYVKKMVRHFEDPENLPEELPVLTDEQREQLRKNAGPVFRKMMHTEVQKYFDLPPEDRTAHLDTLIDRMQGWRKAMQTLRRKAEARADSTGAPRPPHPGRDFTPERVKEFIEKTSPRERAQFVEFMMAVHKRARERKIDLRPPRPQK